MPMKHGEVLVIDVRARGRAIEGVFDLGRAADHELSHALELCRIAHVAFGADHVANPLRVRIDDQRAAATESEVWFLLALESFSGIDLGLDLWI